VTAKKTNVLPNPILSPLGLLLTRLVEALIERNVALCLRMGTHAESSFLIEPTGLPLVLRLVPSATRPVLEAWPRGDAPWCDARIAGSLQDLVALVSGEVDGDSLFFSRRLEISGDTEAVLALRNAIDATGFDLLDEIEAILGVAALPLRVMRDGATRLQRLASSAQARVLAPAMARLAYIERELAQLRQHQVAGGRRRSSVRVQRESHPEKEIDS
jgi:O2-independent ubiquinone biosynthesis accessory factor UbiT